MERTRKMLLFFFLSLTSLMLLGLYLYIIHYASIGGTFFQVSTILNVTPTFTLVETRESKVSVDPHSNSSHENATVGVLSQKLYSLASLMAKPIQTLRNIRQRLIEGTRSEPWIPLAGRRKLIFGRDKDYFDAIGAHSQIQTVFVSAQMAEVTSYMVRDYYDSAATDCQLVQLTFIKGRNETYEHDRCSENIEQSALHPRRVLEYGHLFNIGLPKGFDWTRDPRDRDTAIRPYDGSGIVDRNLHTVRRSRGQEQIVVLSYIHVVKHGVVTSRGEFFSGGLQVVPRRCHERPSPPLSAHAAEALVEHQEVFSVAQYWGEGFFHNTIENLPRLALYVEFLNKHKEIKLHVATKRRYLGELLGISRERLVTGTVRARVLYVPAGTPCGWAVPIAIQSLSFLLRDGYRRMSDNRATSHVRDTIVLIKRSAKRYFKNHYAILSMLEYHARARGLSVVVFGDKPLPSLTDTGLYFGKAVMVVAPHGAGESNLLLSWPGTVLIEALCYEGGKTNICYKHLAQSLGHRYYAILFDKECMDITSIDLSKPVIGYLDAMGYKEILR